MFFLCLRQEKSIATLKMHRVETGNGKEMMNCFLSVLAGCALGMKVMALITTQNTALLYTAELIVNGYTQVSHCQMIVLVERRGNPFCFTL